jgi:hypothetical protein
MLGAADGGRPAYYRSSATSGGSRLGVGMDEVVRSAVVMALAQGGRDVLGQPQRFKALMADALGARARSFRPDVDALVAVVEAGMGQQVISRGPLDGRTRANLVADVGGTDVSRGALEDAVAVLEDAAIANQFIQPAPGFVRGEPTSGPSAVTLPPSPAPPPTPAVTTDRTSHVESGPPPPSPDREVALTATPEPRTARSRVPFVVAAAVLLVVLVAGVAYAITRSSDDDAVATGDTGTEPAPTADAAAGLTPQAAFDEALTAAAPFAEARDAAVRSKDDLLAVDNPDLNAVASVVGMECGFDSQGASELSAGVRAHADWGDAQDEANDYIAALSTRVGLGNECQTLAQDPDTQFEASEKYVELGEFVASGEYLSAVDAFRSAIGCEPRDISPNSCT